MRERDEVGRLVSSIDKAICWSGPAVIILFTLGRAEARLRESEFELAGMRPDSVETFPISADPGGRQAVVREYDLTFDDVGREFVPYLRQCLRKAAERADGIAWSAFEGVFHFDHLFTEDVADKIYGYCVKGDEPVVVWDHESLRSGRWKDGVRGVRSVLESAYPLGEPE
ncbi:hypothetical protein [Streptomyces cavernae]|uniref:hypothetical protein n=1 Tax=Streptomyces cavernae TaxID=2259034 RepID=UPI000FEC0237|nr:hypothetical protein [Streptomyces cavernae]